MVSIIGRRQSFGTGQWTVIRKDLPCPIGSQSQPTSDVIPGSYKLGESLRVFLAKFQILHWSAATNG